MIRIRSKYPPEHIAANLIASRKRGLPPVEAGKNRGAVSVVAGGPSFALADLSRPVVALNGAIRHVDRCDYAICYDMDPRCAAFYADRKPSVQYLIGSRADPATFDALRDLDVRLWHVNDAPEQTFEKIANWPMQPMVGMIGSPSVGLTGLTLLRYMGFTDFHLYGYDSCYVDGKHHGYVQRQNDADPVMEVAFGGRTFTSTTWMIKQAELSIPLFELLRKAGCTIKVYGDGLIAWVDMFRAMGGFGPNQTASVTIQSAIA